MQFAHTVYRCSAIATVLVALSYRAFGSPPWAINEPFTNSVLSAGWLVQGRTNLVNKDDAGGVAVEPTNLLAESGVPNGFIRLTTTNGGYQRVSAFYTSDWFYASDWIMEGELNCQTGADGIAFSWVSIYTGLWVGIEGSVNETNYLLKTLGGSGGAMGVPRKIDAEPSLGCGAYLGVSGYSLQFDTYNNTAGAKKVAPSEYATIKLRNLYSWGTEASTSNLFGQSNTFANGDWIKFRLVQNRASNGVFNLSWGTNYENSCMWFKSGYDPALPVMFGVSAGCGGMQSEQYVRNFRVYGETIPEPASIIAALAFLALVRRKR